MHTYNRQPKQPGPSLSELQQTLPYTSCPPQTSHTSFQPFVLNNDSHTQAAEGNAAQASGCVDTSEDYGAGIHSQRLRLAWQFTLPQEASTRGT